MVLFGTGGHSRSLESLLRACHINVRGAIDFNRGPGEFIPGEKIGNLEVIGSLDAIENHEECVLAIGDNLTRKLWYKEKLETLTDGKISQENLIHPEALIDELASFGEGNQVLANVVVQTMSSIGSNNIFNTGCIIEHEVCIGSHCHISVGSILCGRVRIEDEVFIGAGAVVVPEVKICSKVVVGAGSTVIQSIHEPGIYVGSPARKIR